jgi:DNA invertase Pin-like site-specific DNA recombinase
MCSSSPRLDRLARSTRGLRNVLDEIGKHGAGFKSLKDAWADTAQRTGALLRAKRWLDVARSYAVDAAMIMAAASPFERGVVRRPAAGEGREG